MLDDPNSLRRLNSATRRTFHELNSISLVRLMKSSTFGLGLKALWEEAKPKPYGDFFGEKRVAELLKKYRRSRLLFFFSMLLLSTRKKIKYRYVSMSFKVKTLRVKSDEKINTKLLNTQRKGFMVVASVVVFYREGGLTA